MFALLVALANRPLPTGVDYDRSMLKVPEIDASTHRRWMNIETALYLMNIPFAMFLAANEYKRAVHSLTLDENLLECLFPLTGIQQLRDLAPRGAACSSGRSAMSPGASTCTRSFTKWHTRSSPVEISRVDESGSVQPPCPSGARCSDRVRRFIEGSRPMAPRTSSSAIRERLDHPVIDADGHCVEYHPAIRAILEEVAGTDVAERYQLAPVGHFNWYDQSVERRIERRTIRPPWWSVPSANTADRAMAVIPQVMYERLDEAGVDFSVLYPTLGLFTMAIANDELRQAGCRAFNLYYHRVYGPYADRLRPNAIIPMHTPEEAIAELDYAVGELGFQSVLLAGHVRRPIPAAVANDQRAGRYALWFDNLAVDSEYDYDPVWQRCVDLGVAPTFHSGGQGWGSRQSVSNYVYNHIGSFAAACEAICKSLFLGGVTTRFPTLKFAFLEGGVGWASNLYNDLVGHHEKRNHHHLGHYDPTRLDTELITRLMQEKGSDLLAIAGEQSLGPAVAMMSADREPAELLDEFAATGLDDTAEIGEAFTRNFYFGCEADDRMNALAFDSRLNAFGARLKAIFSSDIGHWDVPDISEVLVEAWELVDDGLLTEDDFRAFTFGNVAELYTGGNTHYFDGTVVADAVGAITSERSKPSVAD